MDRDDIISMARAAGADIAYYRLDMVEGMKFPNYEALERFAAMVAKAEREECAEVAESLWRRFQDTKEAHERFSQEPFMADRFGFHLPSVHQSRNMAEAIRSRGNNG